MKKIPQHLRTVSSALLYLGTFFNSEIHRCRPSFLDYLDQILDRPEFCRTLSPFESLRIPNFDRHSGRVIFLSDASLAIQDLDVPTGNNVNGGRSYSINEPGNLCTHMAKAC